jgi:hypothetical protein
VLYYNGDEMAPLSKKQKIALGMIDKIEDEFGSRWFTKAELPGITQHTMDALVQRGHLTLKWLNDVMYYKLKIVVEV